MTNESAGAVARRFVESLRSDGAAVASSLVSPEVPAGTMSAERLRALWTQLTSQLGTLAKLRPGPVADEDGRVVAELSARFARSEVTLRVVLDPERRVTGFWVAPPRSPAYEPPAYVDTSAFDEVELRFGRAPELPAVFTRPTAPGPWPVVVLVHGSGPNDRDETLGANRPFRDLAWGLASRGVAVLRYDKRTHAAPASLDANVTVETEVIEDALAALDAARTLDGVDPARVVLVGHSLGAGLAPEIARRDGRVAGVVMLAPSARLSAEVLMEQLAHVDSADRAAGGAGIPSIDALRRLLEQMGTRELPPDSDVLGVPASYWYDLDDRRPLDEARALDVPLLALFGGRDYQVTSEDARLWGEAVANRTSAAVRTYHDLNHLFMTGEGMATPAEYAMRTGHVDTKVVTDLADWITGLERRTAP